MIRFTTPIEKIVLRGIDLSDKDVYVSFKQRLGHNQGTTLVEKEGDDLDVTYDGTDTTVLCPLTQEETGSFSKGNCSVQVNWINANGTRDATARIATVPVTDNLHEEVISYGE